MELFLSTMFLIIATVIIIVIHMKVRSNAKKMEQAFAKLEIGMTLTQARIIMGEPTRQNRTEDFIVWSWVTFRRRNAYHIRDASFRDNSLVSKSEYRI